MQKLRAWQTGVLGILIGAIAGLVVGIVMQPYLYPPPALNETVSAEQVKIASGIFNDASPSDPIHYGEGSVSVYKNLLHLEGDFEVRPGPAFHVYLTKDLITDSETRVQNLEFVDLGRLRAFKGSQNYNIPPNVNPLEYSSVVVWCAAHNVLIAPATLKKAQ